MKNKSNNKALNIKEPTTSNTFFKALRTQLQFSKARKKVTTRENERKQENVSEGELVVFLGETIVNAIVILQIEEVTYLAIINIFLFYFHAINQLSFFLC